VLKAEQEMSFFYKPWSAAVPRAGGLFELLQAVMAAG